MDWDFDTEQSMHNKQDDHVKRQSYKHKEAQTHLVITPQGLAVLQVQAQLAKGAFMDQERSTNVGLTESLPVSAVALTDGDTRGQLDVLVSVSDLDQTREDVGFPCLERGFSEGADVSLEKNNLTLKTGRVHLQLVQRALNLVIAGPEGCVDVAVLD